MIVVGAGALGSFVGGMLAAAGGSVILVDAWPEHIAAIRHEGLRISGTHGEHRVRVEALHVHEVQSLHRRPLSAAFIAVKAYDTEWASALVKDYLTPEAHVVSLQNGYNEETIARVIGRGPVMGCIASTLGAEIVGPGHVTRACEPGGDAYDVFRVGELDGRITGRVSWVVEQLRKVDSATATTNLVGERWSKIVQNSMANPLAAITGLKDREMILNAGVRRLSIRLAAEAIAVGEALGYSLPPVLGTEPAVWTAAAGGRDLETLEQALVKVAQRSTDRGRPSTPVDIALGRRTELDFFNGLIIEKGRALGIPTPVHKRVLDMARAVERGELSPDVGNLEPLL